MAGKIGRTLKELYAVHGVRARLMAPLAGRYVFRKLCQEERRLSQGWTYEPPTIYEKNRAASSSAG